MSKNASMLAAIALAAFAIPAMAQDAAKPTKAEQDRIQAQTASEKRDTGSMKAKTPEQVAADKATLDKNSAKANQPAATAQEKRIERTGNETRDVGTAKKKSPEQKAKDKADKAKKQPGATTEELDKAKKVSPGT